MSITPSEQYEITDRSLTNRSTSGRRPSLLPGLLTMEEDTLYQFSPIWLEFKDSESEKKYVLEELVIAARQQRLRGKFCHAMSIVIASCIILNAVLGQIFPFYSSFAVTIIVWYVIAELTVIIPTYIFDTRFNTTMENAAETLVDARVIWSIALVALWFILLATESVGAQASIFKNVNSNSRTNKSSVIEIDDVRDLSAVLSGFTVTYLWVIGIKVIISTGFRFRMKHNYLAFLVTSTSVSVWLFAVGNVHFVGKAGQLWMFYLICSGFCVFMDLVTSLVPTYIYELSQRRNFILQQALKKNIENKTKINRALTNENAEMQKRLKTASILVKNVMSEGGALLRAFELERESLEYGEKQLGEGSFGTVFLGVLRGEYKVAVKTMRVSKINKSELAKFKSELIIMCPLHHPNLVKLYGGVWSEGADKLCIVLEFCPHGSLATYLKAVRGSWESLHYGLALGAAKGLAYLHSDLKEPLMHRDIKPENILVGEGVVAKLADFGESRNFDQGAAKKQAETGDGESDALSMTMVGTRLFCAPEIMLGQRYNESADTYSYALVLLCLVSGNVTYVKEQYPILHAPSGNLMHLRPPIPPSVLEKHAEIALLIKDMWQGNFRLRPSMRNVVSSLTNVEPAHYCLQIASSVKANIIESESAILEAQSRHECSSKNHAVFLSHHKDACATEARFVKNEYERLLGVGCFLDSDNLRDLRELVDHVKDSDTLIIFLSKEVLRRPWCLIELHTAIENNVPIVALNCQGKGYDFVEANDFMLHLETSLATLNPGAVDILKANAVDPIRLAHKLWSTIPNIIAIPFNTAASDNAIKAMMADLVKAIAVAKPLPIEESFEQWRESRAERERLELEEALDNGTIRGTQRGRMLQKIERADEIAAELRLERERVAKLETRLEKQSARIEKQIVMIESMSAKHDVALGKERGFAASLMTKNDRLMEKIERLEAKVGY